jgi:hypothetical protein
MIGTPASRDMIIPRADTPDVEQALQKEFYDQGTIANPDIWSRYATIMKGPGSYRNQLNVWEEMASWDLLAAVLAELVEEAVNWDQFNPGPLWYECNNRDFQTDLNKMLKRIDNESLIASQAYGIAGLGNHFERVHYARGTGVQGLSYIPAHQIRRYWLDRNKRCIGYMWDNHKPDKDSVWAGPDNSTQIERVAINRGGRLEELWYPWDIVHFRRLFRARDTEHGEPICSEAEGIYKKLRMAVDQMVVHRAQVQPDRYVINIDTQEQPPTEQVKTVNAWRRAMRTRQSFGQGGGTDMRDPSDFRSFYNPLALDTIMWVARPKGFNHSIEKLAGTTQVPDVFDIELLTDLFFSIVGAPKMWFGLGATKDSSPPSGRALLASDIRSLRKVRSIRRPLLAGYLWLAYFHAVLVGKNPAELTINTKMSDIGGLEDQMKLELLTKKAELLSSLGQVMDQYHLPKDAWVDLVFRRYLHLPDEVVNQFLTVLPQQMNPIEMEALRAGNIQNVSTKTLLDAIDQRVQNSKKLQGLICQVKLLAEGGPAAADEVAALARYETIQDVLGGSTLEENDIAKTANEEFSVTVPPSPGGNGAGDVAKRKITFLKDSRTPTSRDGAAVKTVWESSSWRRFMPKKPVLNG